MFFNKNVWKFMTPTYRKMHPWETFFYLNFSSNFLQPSRGNPCRWMVWVCFSDRLEEESGLFDVVDVSTVGGYHGLKVGEVALGVDHRLSRDRVRGLLEFEAHQTLASFADLSEVEVAGGGQHPGHVAWKG